MLDSFMIRIDVIEPVTLSKPADYFTHNGLGVLYCADDDQNSTYPDFLHFRTCSLEPTDSTEITLAVQQFIYI